LRYDAPPFVERHNESGSFHLCAAQQVIGHGRSIACLSSIFLKMMLNAARSRRSIPAFGVLTLVLLNSGQSHFEAEERALNIAALYQADCSPFPYEGCR
jgi:hypothetical protein